VKRLAFIFATLLALVVLHASVAARVIVEPVEFPLEVDGAKLRLVATVLRPESPGPHPLVVLSHGAWGPEARRREQLRLSLEPMSRWFAERGYAVIVSMRRGYGASEGAMAESSGGCSDPDYARAGLASAADILAAARWLQAQHYADPERLFLVGYSAGGWGTLAAASLAPRGLVAAINLAGGRGGLSGTGWPCMWSRMLEAAERFGSGTRVPSLWLYATHDALFGPMFAEKLAAAWRLGGGSAELEILAPEYADGHGLFMATDGPPHWAPLLTRFLDRVRSTR
jgi:dienelactone hydrolase